MRGDKYLVIPGEMMLAGRPAGSVPGDPRYVETLICLQLDDEFMAAYAAATPEVSP